MIRIPDRNRTLVVRLSLLHSRWENNLASAAAICCAPCRWATTWEHGSRLSSASDMKAKPIAARTALLRFLGLLRQRVAQQVCRRDRCDCYLATPRNSVLGCLRGGGT